MTDYKFEGWMGLDKDSVDGKMVWQEFEPKPWEETDVDIKVSHCGICGSDLHTLHSGWKPTLYPCCVGHEIVGVVVRVGSQVSDIKLGDRVGVGAQSDSCQGRLGDCAECAMGWEQYCPHKWVGTYNSVHLNGGKSYGGYALYNRVPARFAIKIPDGIPSAEAAPMLCGGVTLYSPLKHNGCGPGKRVGIIGVGGLGHFGVMFAKAMGADKVVAISRKAGKAADALKMGADLYIATDDEPDWATKYAKSLDLIISTVSSTKMPMEQYVGLLAVNGTLCQVGLPEDGTLVAPVKPLIRRLKVTSSLVGSPDEIREMFQLVLNKGVKPWIEEVPMKNANEAIVNMHAGKARYRYVLVNEEH
ncbi:NAD(P)-dependent alcohol dehydrogenase [Aspergillus brunneoviolaceus CBS 621.78]|uniref:alcohol dehydrogenase (NADP(+)) n=2 Tax=Aspergillus TaxID=5052 RepID=A0A8G1RTN9_9EURO|nr:putative alcohol dehydrogenase [Aspergillus brunneoviolaceus CBS 621.78]XP_040802684.1 putative alcohol dehydrogenase [Aspergillus fijiensis CBS 313.89]RAH43679.1 putative alcohol dehydrogenase [Aspergillus brunneoviolaceus CBS 621.78]RAK78674.1 putative alcohol dehydrogenase [Aspergillus fijiensis CBS 313.89]